MFRQRLLQASIATLFATTFPLTAGEKYEIESVFSTVLFKVRHMQTANAWGRFDQVAGTLDYENGDLTKSSLALTIKADSVNTNSEKRDDHLRGPDFFNAKEFETITFKSTKIEKSGEDYMITGDLTMLGVTKSVTATCEFYGEGKSPRGDQKILGAEATFKVKRTDFGMNYGVPNIGDEVTLIVSVEALEVK